MSKLSLDYREDCLRRKLALILGSQKDWLVPYRDWCAANDVSTTMADEDHNINIFVKQQRGAAHV